MARKAKTTSPAEAPKVSTPPADTSAADHAVETSAPVQATPTPTPETETLPRTTQGAFGMVAVYH